MDRTEIEELIRDLSGQRKTYREISDILNGRNIPTFSGRGKWHRGTVVNVLRKMRNDVLSENRQGPDDSPQEKAGTDPEPVTLSGLKSKRTPEPDELHTVRKAYKSALAGLDKSVKETAELRKALQEKETETAELKAEIRRLTQNKPCRQRTIEDILTVELTQNEKSRAEGVLSEILERLSGIEKRIGMAFSGRAGKRKALNIEGWTIQRDGRGLYRGFRNIRGRVYGMYLGKDISDEKLIKQKLTAKYQALTGQNQDVPKPDDRADQGGEQS